MTDPTVPVRLTIGKQTYLAGSVPDLGDVPDDVVRPILGELVERLGREVEHAAQCLATERDKTSILAAHRAALTLAVRSAPDHTNPTGPMTRILRESAGMTLTDLALAMGHDRRSVRRWEEGRSSRFTIAEDWRASVALGYAPTAIVGAYMALTAADPVRPTPRASGGWRA